MKCIALPILIIALAALTGCTGMKINSDRDPAFDFSAVTTFQWVDAPAEILNKDDTYLNIDLQKSLNNKLSALGWNQVLETNEASVLVVYYIKFKEHEEYTETASPDERPFSGGLVYNRTQKKWSYDEREPDLNIYTVKVGTLTLLIYDTQSGQRVWRGTLQTKLNRSQPLEKRQDRLRKVARKLVEQVPVGTK